MKWDVCSAYIVLDLLEDTSVVSLANLTKVKAAVGLYEYWWADEPLLQNWVIGSALISIWWQRSLGQNDTTRLYLKLMRKLCRLSICLLQYFLYTTTVHCSIPLLYSFCRMLIFWFIASSSSPSSSIVTENNRPEVAPERLMAFSLWVFFFFLFLLT